MVETLVERRYGNQLQTIQSFTRPNEMWFRCPDDGNIYNALDRAALHRTNPEQHEVWIIWDWVCRTIKYPPYRSLSEADYHHQEEFLRYGPFWPTALKKSTAYDFWQYPSETLGSLIGDCEDSGFLLVSMLRNMFSADAVWLSIGMWENYGHAWPMVVNEGQNFVLETTIEQAPAFETNPYRIPEEYPYTAFAWVNDQRVVWASEDAGVFFVPKVAGQLIEEIKEAYKPFMVGSFIEEIREAYQGVGGK